MRQARTKVKSLQVFHFVMSAWGPRSNPCHASRTITTFTHQAVHGYVRRTIPLMSTSCAVSAACPQSDVAVHLYHIDIMHHHALNACVPLDLCVKCVATVSK